MNLKAKTFINRKKKSQINAKVKAFWKSDIYSRTYTNRSNDNVIKELSDVELKTVFASLKKYTEADEYNCSACGYGSCKNMAKAIYNGLNQVNNCHFYKETQLAEMIEEVAYTMKSYNFV